MKKIVFYLYEFGEGEWNRYNIVILGEEDVLWNVIK